MQEHERIAVQTDAYGMRLLDFLEQRWPQVHRAYFRRLVLAELVKVNRIIGTPYTTLRRGDIVDITRPPGELPPRPGPRAPARPQARLLAVTSTYSVLDKPAGQSVDEALQALGDERLAGARPVLRMDADASGLVLLAHGAESARTVLVDHAEGRLELTWLALVDGRIERDAMTIDKALGPDRKHPGRVRVYERDAKRSRDARTDVSTVEVFARHSLLRLVPRTDRGHQLRVHLAAVHHPVVGDAVYGRGPTLLISSFKRKYRPRVGVPERPILERLFLHAHALRWQGDDGERQWTSPLPKDLDAALQRLRRYADR